MYFWTESKSENVSVTHCWNFDENWRENQTVFLLGNLIAGFIIVDAPMSVFRAGFILTNRENRTTDGGQDTEYQSLFRQMDTTIYEGHFFWYYLICPIFFNA